MKFHQYPFFGRTEQDRNRERLAGLIVGGLLALLNIAAIGAEPAATTDEGWPSAPRGLIDDPFSHDPGFNAGQWQHGDFGQSSRYRNRHGRKIVRLSNGHVVVVGTTGHYPPGGQNFPNDPQNGMWNIGLARYDANGAAVGWTSPGSYQFGPNYVVFPNAQSPQFDDVKDVKLFGDHIYILVDRWRENSTGPNNRLDAYVVVFRTDGVFIGQHAALNFSSTLHETGAGMAFFQPPGILPTPPAQLYIAGTTTGANGRPFITLTRMIRGSSGALTRSTDLGPGSNQSYVDYSIPDGYCVAGARPCHMVANDLAITPRGIGGTVFPRIYIGGTVRRETSGNWAFLAIRTNGAGVLDTTLCTNANCHGYAMITGLSGGRRAEVYAIVPRTVNQIQGNDEIFLVGDVERNDSGVYRGSGVGVVKLDNRGDRVTAFANNGTRLFGGCASAFCSIAGEPSDHPRAAVLDGRRLAIVGWSGIDPAVLGMAPGPYWVKRPLFAMLDAETGVVTDNRLLPTTSTYYGYGEALDIAPASADGYALGGYRWSDPNGANFIATRIRSDRIFGDGFQP